MAQKDNRFMAFWMDTTTAPWTPLTGLSATILIKLATSPYTVVVNNEAMTDIGNGDYIYIFAGYSSDQDYIYHCSPWATAYILNGQTDSRQDYLDKSITEIAVWWNPYITGIGGLQKGIQKIVNKIEEKGDEVIKSFPEYKEPIVNVTTEKVDMSHMEDCIKCMDDNIKAIKIPEHKETDLSNVLKEIKSIGKIVDIKFPEQKEVVFNEIIDIINSNSNELKTSIENSEEKVINTIQLDKKVSQAFSEFILDRIPAKESENARKEQINSEEFMKKPLPNNFTATLN